MYRIGACVGSRHFIFKQTRLTHASHFHPLTGFITRLTFVSRTGFCHRSLPHQPNRVSKTTEYPDNAHDI